MLCPIRTVTGLTGDASQHKLTGNGVVASRMAGETFSWFFGLLQIHLKDWVERSLGVSGV
jgi:hypothetical protein